MKFTKKFTEFVETCKAENQYVGLGNPNADILIVGEMTYFRSILKLHKVRP